MKPCARVVTQALHAPFEAALYLLRLMRIADDVRALWCRELRASLDALQRAFGIQLVAQPVKEHVDQEGTAKQSKRR